MVSLTSTENIPKSKSDHNTQTCPYTKIIEDIFNVNNKSSLTPISNSERAKLFLHSIAKVTESNEELSQEELVNDIIAAINRIKNNITKENNTETKLNEAIILGHKNTTDNRDDQKNIIQIKSGIEDKIDIKTQGFIKTPYNSHFDVKADANKTLQHTTTENINYVEVLTIEPNNTYKNNVSTHNIIEVLKHLMPMFNSTLTKELHNITVIERYFNKNHSFSATKNVSTIVVTYCDKDNSSKTNITFESGKETSAHQISNNQNYEDDYYTEKDDATEDYEEENVAAGENRDILEAAEYGMQKMHELYSVLEPKLYSMGKHRLRVSLQTIFNKASKFIKYLVVVHSFVLALNSA